MGALVSAYRLPLTLDRERSDEKVDKEIDESAVDRGEDWWEPWLSSFHDEAMTSIFGKVQANVLEREAKETFQSNSHPNRDADPNPKLN